MHKLLQPAIFGRIINLYPPSFINQSTQFWKLTNHAPRRFMSNNIGSTAYPSGSVKNPTQIIINHQPPSSTSSSSSPVNQINHPTKTSSIPLQHRQLPELPNRRPIQVLIFMIIGIIWISFIKFSTNSEKFNSSIIKEILFQLRNNSKIQFFLGFNNHTNNNNNNNNNQNDYIIKPLRDVYFNQVWVDGNINLMQGSIDVAFSVTGSHHSGKVYFTSVRRDRESEFEIIRWKLIRDDGEVLDLLNGKSGSKILKENKEGGNEKIEIISIIDNNSNHNHSYQLDHDKSNQIPSEFNQSHDNLNANRLV